MSRTGMIAKTLGIRETAFFARVRAFYRRRQAAAELSHLARETSPQDSTRILAINHFFHGELKALGAALPSFPGVKILPIKPEPFFSEVLHLFPMKVRNAEIEYDSPELAGHRAEARRISRQIFDRIAAVFPFDCVLTPSDSFYWLREFVHVCREKGIPFVVSDKEGTISPASYETHPRAIRKYFPPLADLFLVWSSRQKDFWIKCGVRPETIIITGAARSDAFLNMQRHLPDTVIFFDFDLDAYINTVDWSKTNWEGERSWRELRNAFRHAALRIAKNHPNVKVILKCHPQQTSKGHDLPKLKETPNLQVITGAEISDLMPRAYAVAGFQTTALMEAVMAKIPTFYAAWGDLYETIKPEILPFHDPSYGMRLCQNENEIVEGIGEAISAHGKLPLIPAPGLEIFFERRDGQASARIIGELLKIARQREHLPPDFPDKQGGRSRPINEKRLNK